MRFIAADRYRHFVPSAPPLTFHIKPVSISGEQTLTMEYVQGQGTVDPLIVKFRYLTVWINGLEQSPDNYYTFGYSLVISKYTVSRHSSDGSFEYVTYQGSPPPGFRIKVKGSDGIQKDFWNHLDIRRLLVQGAQVTDNQVIAKSGFQGGYRLRYVALGDVHFGKLRVCDSHLGWDYEPTKGWQGLDSFSYCLETEFGQRSDASCVSIYVGVS